MTKVIYTQKVLEMMFEARRSDEVNGILKNGVHRNRKCGNYVILEEKR